MSSQRSLRGSVENGNSGQTQECVASPSWKLPLPAVPYSSNVELCLSLQAVIALMEMGFDEKEVVDALRVNNNQQDAAVGVLAVKKQRQKTHYNYYFNWLQYAYSLFVKIFYGLELTAAVWNVQAS